MIADQDYIHYAQKLMQEFVNFVHTCVGHRDIIIHVKTPQYIIYSFYYTP